MASEEGLSGPQESPRGTLDIQISLDAVTVAHLRREAAACGLTLERMAEIYCERQLSETAHHGARCGDDGS